MAILGKLAKAGVFGIAGALLGGKKKKPPVAQLGTATRDDAAALVAQEDELRRRKGGAADILNGVTGTEAALSGGKLVLGN